VPPPSAEPRWRCQHRRHCLDVGPIFGHSIILVAKPIENGDAVVTRNPNGCDPWTRLGPQKPTPRIGISCTAISRTTVASSPLTSNIRSIAWPDGRPSRLRDSALTSIGRDGARRRILRSQSRRGACRAKSVTRRLSWNPPVPTISRFCPNNCVALGPAASQSVSCINERGILTTEQGTHWDSRGLSGMVSSALVMRRS
jgi:hypothetical protein